MNSFYDAVDGVRTGKTVAFRNDRGEDVRLNVHEIVGRLAPIDSPGAREAAFMADAADGVSVQGDVPRPVDLRTSADDGGRSRGGRLRLPRGVRRARDRDRARRWSRTRSPRARDTSSSTSRCIRTWSIRRGSSGSRRPGTTSADVLDAAIAADIAVLEGIPDDVITGLHICRGNFRSSWMCEGSLEPVAERVFGQLPYDTFLVEWDDLGRDGGFEPIRFLRDGSVMVMGIVSSKVRELEDEEDLVRRMEQAAVDRRRARPARDQPAMRVRQRDDRQRHRRGHPVAQARAGRPRRGSALGA